MYFETVLRMNIRASRKEGKYIRALMVVDLAGLSFSTLCARPTPALLPLLLCPHAILHGSPFWGMPCLRFHKGPSDFISALGSSSASQIHHRCLVHRFNANILRRVASTATANFAELCSKVFVVNAPSFAVKGWNLIK